MKHEKDIFDKIMHLSAFRIFEPFYIKNKEVLMYLFFGGVAFFLNLFLFFGIDYVFSINELINNGICWVICVLFQFFTNRTWVFRVYTDTVPEFIMQMMKFCGGRVFTLVVEEFILAIFITWLGLNTVIVKLAAQVITIALNYILSKFFVFKNKI